MRRASCLRGPYHGAVRRAGRLGGSLGDVDILAVDHLEDRARAGSVPVLVHGDLAGDAGKVLEAGEAASDLVAISIEITWIIGYTGCLDAVLVGIDDVVGPWTAVGRLFATVPIDDLLQIGLHLWSGIIEPGRGRHVGAFGRRAGDLNESRCAGAGPAHHRHLEPLLMRLLGDRRCVLVAGSEGDTLCAQRLGGGNLGRVVGVLRAICQHVENLDTVLLQERRHDVGAFGLGYGILRVIDDNHLLGLIGFDPGGDDGLQLLVARQRIAERPLAHGREPGLGGTIGVDDGLQPPIELRGYGLELRAEAWSGDHQDLVALDQAAHRLERLGLGRLRVVAYELDRQTADAALGVDFLNGNLHRELRGLTPLGALTGQGCEAADLDVATGELLRFAMFRR